MNLEDVNNERRRLQANRGMGSGLRDMADTLADGIEGAGQRGSRRGRRGRRRGRRRRRRRRPRRRRERFSGIMRSIRNRLCGGNRCYDAGFKDPCKNSGLSIVVYYIYRLIYS